MGGHYEYVLPDKKRVDCLTSRYAIETDWGKKWAESIGQSLSYSVATGKQPAIYLLLRNKKDEENLTHLKMINRNKKLNIKFFWTKTLERTHY